MDYRKTAEAIYEKVGKRENLVSVAHCSTRLRLVLADDKKCDAKAVEDIDGVKGVFSASGQLQVILGTGVLQAGDQDSGRHFCSDYSGYRGQRFSDGNHGSIEFYGK